MVILIPVKYHYRKYPDIIHSIIQEMPGHLDVTSVRPAPKYILHTEYSSPKRKLDSIVLQGFNALRTAHVDSVPQLWFNKQWAKEFAGFIETIIGENKPPLAIEIHPPYRDYCPTIKQFCEIYGEFESLISAVYPDTDILIENRYGTLYRKGKFLISSYHDIVDLASNVDKEGLRLGIVLDLPQMISQIGGVSRLSNDRLNDIFSILGTCRDKIRSMHLWGKRRLDNGRLGVHIGNLDDYFEDNKKMKIPFLEKVYDLMDDGLPRYFVPEVNSGDRDLASIVHDLISVGFTFQDLPEGT